MKNEDFQMKRFSRPAFFILHLSFLLLPSFARAQDTLTLDRALKLAFEANPSYRIAKVDEKAAANNATWGKAGLLPRLDADGLWNRRYYDSPGAQGSGSDGNGTEVGTAALRASWTVFEGLASFSAKSRLETQARIASLRSDAARQDLGAAVILAYGNAVRHHRLLLALDSVLAFSHERVRLTQGKYAVGSASKLDLLQARIDLNADSSTRLRQDLSLAGAKRDLNLLFARAEDTPFEVEDTVELSALPPLESLRAKALESSPVILQAAENQRLASIAYSEYMARLYPKVGVNAGYSLNFNTNQQGFLLPGEQRGWNYGATMNWAIFDGGQVLTDMKNARLASGRADLQFEESRNRVVSGLARAWDDYRTSLAALSLEQENLGLARENGLIARERLRLGTISSLELRDAQEDFLEAENRLANARYDAKRSETELLRLAARLVPSSP